jgi:hypothetical protein
MKRSSKRKNSGLSLEQNAETTLKMMCCEIGAIGVRLSYHAD